MSNKEYNIEILDAPTEKDMDNKSPHSWLYKKTGIIVNEFDKQDKAEKDYIKEEEYKKYWDSLTDGERFAITRDTTAGEGRPEKMTVDEWEVLPNWKKAWYRGVKDSSPYRETMKDLTTGVGIGFKDTLVNAFSLPLEISDAIGASDEAATAFREAIDYIDPLQPENSIQAITAVLTQYGVPSIAVVNWMNKFKRAPGFWNAMKKYAKTIGMVGVTDAVVSGPGDINLATAFGDNWWIPAESFLTIHEDDPSLVRRVKIGTEMVWVGPLVDTLVMAGGGLYKGGRFLLGNADPKKKIEYTDINGNKQEFWTSERSFNAVAKIMNDMSSGPRTLEEIEETLKLFQGSGIIPPTGAAAGSPGLIHLQNLFNVGGYSDVTVKNLLAMNENIDAVLKANGLSDGINSQFITTKTRELYNNVNAKIAAKEETLTNLKLEQKGAVSEAKATLKENESILQRELNELKEQRKVIETEIKDNFTNEFNAAKDEVVSYINKVGLYEPGTMNQLAHSLDEELINQFAYLTVYKNQLYKNIDVDPNTGVQITHNIKDFKIDDKDTVFSLLKNDINNFIKKKDAYDTVVKKIPKDLINELKTLINPKNKDSLTIGRLEELRASFTKAYKDAIDANDTVLAERILTSKRQIFDNLYDNIAKVTDTQYAGMAERAQNASNWFKNEYAPRFEEGVGSMWAEALKKRKSGSLGSSSPEQSPLYFLKHDGQGLYINNSSESGINQIENILNPPKDEFGEFLNKQLIDPYTNKPLNISDKANTDKIIENFFAAKIAQALHNQTNVSNSLKILEKFEEAYYPILDKYPKIANQIEEYKTTLKEKNAKVTTIESKKKEVELLEKENTLKKINQKKDSIEELKIKDQKNVDAINASFSEKIDIASEELKLLSNERNNNLNLFSFFVNDSPANAINKAMNDADPVDAISKLRAEINAFNIPELSKGFDESVSQWLRSQILHTKPRYKIPATENIKYKGFKYEANLEGLDDILSNPQKVQALEAAGWSADDIAALGKFSEQLTILERSNLTAKGASKAEITDPAQVGRKAQILAASIYGIVKGRGVMAIMNLIGGALGISPMKAQSLLLQDAMTHPELAKILLMKDSEESVKLLKGYVINNYLASGNTREEFKEEDIQYNIEEIQNYNIEPVSRSFVPDALDVNVPDVNRESRLAGNFIQPINDIAAALPNQKQGTGPIDPNRAAIAFGPMDILAQPQLTQPPRYAAQGGIMSTNKAFQRVA